MPWRQRDAEGSDFGNDRVVRLGVGTIVGSRTSTVSVNVALPQKPRRAIINAMHDVLSR